MCGIAAIIGCSHPENMINSMLYTQRHRGESDNEVYCYNNIGLGTRRLAIVGRDNGMQPIWNETGTICIIYNGEIYNFLQLRDLLISCGHVFRTKTDTEVILHAFEEFGIHSLNMLDGMFAFVILDKNTGCYFIARDRYGVKPIYYRNSSNCIYVASEGKSLTSCPGTRIRQLGPGEYITNAGVQRWYSPPLSLQLDSFPSAVDKVREFTENAVRKRIVTDLPIVIFLSGGIDSSIILALAKQYKSDIKAITVGLSGASDIKASEEICKYLDIPFHVCIVSEEELYASVRKVIFHTESFRSNMVRAGVFSLMLAREARSLGYKIALCGEGADEIFAGYGDFLKCTGREEFLTTSYRFLDDLFRTQLQRIDRLGMAYTVEVREPFLDKILVEYAINLPYHYKIGKTPDGRQITKLALRQAFRNELPNSVVWRDKVTMMQGAGIGHVSSQSNLLYYWASHQISDNEYQNIIDKYPIASISTKEEAYYFLIYRSFFGDDFVELDKPPLTANYEIEDRGIVN